MGRFVIEQLTFKRKNRKKKTHHVKVENEKQKAITQKIEGFFYQNNPFFKK